MTINFSAIETAYKGRLFRSRLEARWAVFYDALGIKWDYEPEGFNLPSGRYLPDFYLPDLECWIEIKGAKEKDVGDRAGHLLSELVFYTEKDAFLFTAGMGHNVSHLGVPAAWAYFGRPHPSLIAKDILTEYMPRSSPDSEEISIYDYTDGYYFWCDCPTCGNVGLQFDGRSGRLPCKCPSFTAPGNHHGCTYNSPRILAAYTKALSARFEFGEVMPFTLAN